VACLAAPSEATVKASSACLLDGVFNICTPAHCNNGVKDGPETDIDCGGLAIGGEFCGGCPEGKSCASAGVTDANCISQARNDGVCR